VLHALALGRAGADVDLVGFAEPAWRPVGALPSLTIWPLDSGARSQGRATAPSYLLRATVRSAGLFWGLTRLLISAVPRPDVILVQNPPGVPTLFVAWLAALLRRARLVIDWHNLTWGMLSLRVGRNHPLISVVSAYERIFGRWADGNLFVSVAMKDALGRRWGLEGSVFHDRPASAFHPLDEWDRQAHRGRLLTRLGERVDRVAALLVTSTSWSADEDFDLLFDALKTLDAQSARHASPPHSRVVVLITGRGPGREAFEQRIVNTEFHRVGVYTAWLESDEYPRVLAAADLGISLHRSASGLDLPMKVLDMFGAGLPVCALNYGPCLSELVTDGVNGVLFQTSAELAEHLRVLLDGLPAQSPSLERLRRGALRERDTTWEDGWTSEAWPVLAPRHR
jgi:beta-1,4-mannosyltransferase